MKHLVAVYGTLKKGFYNHRVLGEEAVFKGECRLNPEWTMHHLGGFPALVHGGVNGTTRPLVEVYEVSTEQLEGPIDGLEGYPDFYNRMIVPTEYGMAWVYHITDGTLDDLPVIEDGNYQG